MNKFGVNIGKHALSLFYKQNKVKFRNLKKVYRDAIINKEKIDVKRAAFALKIAQMIKDGRQLLYMDESSVTNWTSKVKCWSLREKHAVFPLNKIRYAVTLMGTIGPGLRQPECFGFYRGGTTTLK